MAFICLNALAACASLPPQNDTIPATTHEIVREPVVETASEVATLPESESLPYPNLDKQKQIDDLAIKINKLEEQIKQLNTRIHQLEQRHVPRPQRQKVQPKPVPKNSVKNNLPLEWQNSVANQPISGSDTLAEAQKWYAQNQYDKTIKTLRGADGGGDGSATAQQQMYLLLQSHFKLRHCQSVIQMGRQFVSRFADNAHAPNALFLVGQCQWHIQQRDIAKETWRDIVRRYPNSTVAKSAEKAIKQK